VEYSNSVIDKNAFAEADLVFGFDNVRLKEILPRTNGSWNDIAMKIAAQPRCSDYRH
jgi:hypothetical protein